MSHKEKETEGPGSGYSESFPAGDIALMAFLLSSYLPASERIFGGSAAKRMCERLRRENPALTEEVEQMAASLGFFNNEKKRAKGIRVQQRAFGKNATKQLRERQHTGGQVL